MNLRFLAAFAAFTLGPASALAQAPCAIPLQSYLAGLDGLPLPGPIDIEIRFYDGAGAEAAAIDCRSFPATEVDDGWVSVVLDACSLPEPDASGCGVMTITEILDAGAESESQVFIGIRLGADETDAGPRTPLGAVPYAVYATIAASLEGFDPGEYLRVAGASAAFVPRADYDLLVERVSELETRTESLGDLDGDGASNDIDCAPFDASVFPGAEEIPDDTVDSDCDGDSDGDGAADVIDCAPFDVLRAEPDGSSADCALTDCAAVLAANPVAETGVYWITGGSEDGALGALCDMHTDGGGWTLCGKFDRDSGTGSSLTNPFARARVHSDDLATVSTFSSQQASLDCRDLIRAGAEWTLSAATDGSTMEWAAARLVEIPEEVISDPINLWDIAFDEDGVGVCTNNVMETYDDAGVALGTSDSGAMLDARSAVLGDGAWWSRHERNGATWANAGVTDCTGSSEDTIYWSWVALDGSRDDHGCGVNSGYLTIGTGCGQGAVWFPPTYRYNLLFMR